MRWEELFRASGRPLPTYATARRSRLFAWAARRLGTGLILPLMLAEEGREVQAYLGLARHSTHRLTHKAAVDIAADSTVHACELSEVMGTGAEKGVLPGLSTRTLAVALEGTTRAHRLGCHPQNLHQGSP